MYKGPIYIPRLESTWRLTQPYICSPNSTSNKYDLNLGPEDRLKAAGLKLITSNGPSGNPLFEIPVGAIFKMKFHKSNYNPFTLHFTQVLNKDKVIIGGFTISRFTDQPLYAEEL